MQASAGEIAAVAKNVVVVSTFWMSFQRLCAGPGDYGEQIDLGGGAYQVLAIIAPFLIGDARALLDRLGRDYL